MAEIGTNEEAAPLSRATTELKSLKYELERLKVHLIHHLQSRGIVIDTSKLKSNTTTTTTNTTHTNTTDTISAIGPPPPSQNSIIDQIADVIPLQPSTTICRHGNEQYERLNTEDATDEEGDELNLETPVMMMSRDTAALPISSVLPTFHLWLKSCCETSWWW